MREWLFDLKVLLGSLAIAFIACALMIGFALCVVLLFAPAEYKPWTEFTLSDGTRCVQLERRAVSCEWQERKQ